MGVPSPCVSRRVGDPAFAHMKRVVRLGSPLFSVRPIACHSLERAFRHCFCDVLPHPIAVDAHSSVVILCMV